MLKAGKIIRKHIIPNVVGPVIVFVTLTIPAIILVLAAEFLAEEPEVVLLSGLLGLIVGRQVWGLLRDRAQAGARLHLRFVLEVRQMGKPMIVALNMSDAAQRRGIAIDRGRWNWEAVLENPFFSPDPDVVGEWEALLDSLRRDGSSTGAVVEIVASGLPAGLGAPVYGKLDADLAGFEVHVLPAQAQEFAAFLPSYAAGAD